MDTETLMITALHLNENLGILKKMKDKVLGSILNFQGVIQVWFHNMFFLKGWV